MDAETRAKVRQLCEWVRRRKRGDHFVPGSKRALADDILAALDAEGHAEGIPADWTVRLFCPHCCEAVVGTGSKWPDLEGHITSCPQAQDREVVVRSKAALVMVVETLNQKGDLAPTGSEEQGTWYEAAYLAQEILEEGVPRKDSE